MAFSERQKGILALVGLALNYVLIGIFIRYFDGKTTLFQQVYLRIGVAAVLCLVIFGKNLRYQKWPKVAAREWSLTFFRAFLFFGLGITLFSEAVILAKFSNVSFIAVLPLAAPLGILLLKERPSLEKILLTALAFIGVALVSFKISGNSLSWGWGETLALLSAIFISLSYTLRRFHSKAFNNWELTTLIFWFSFLMVLGFSVFTGESLASIQWSPILILNVLITGVLNVWGIYVMNYGFEKVDAVTAANILTLETVFALVAGFFVFREIPTLIELGGGILITIAALRINRP